MSKIMFDNNKYCKNNKPIDAAYQPEGVLGFLPFKVKDDVIVRWARSSCSNKEPQYWRVQTTNVQHRL